MGQEIGKSEFSAADFEDFRHRLQQETELLARLFAEHAFVSEHEIGGYELEAWFVDQQTRAASINQEFLETLSNPMVVHELSRFNIEINSTPRSLTGRALTDMQHELAQLWQQCTETAERLSARMVMMGILPVVTEDQLTLQNMSDVDRYRALNEQILNLRRGLPLLLAINGREQLHTVHHDVMLEAAATSFQVHLQVRPEKAARFYNASLICAAPLVAATANSPYLFGRDLWDETRIPLFEQAVNTDETGALGRTGRSRVTLGHGYIRDSLFELFEENLQVYPVLLPATCNAEVARLCHLQLHNGTIWRWVRPLIGINDAGLHLRIEQRVIPSGPTIVDMIANAAFYYGMVTAMATADEPPESRLEFVTARDNFYLAAQTGLKAAIAWPGHDQITIRDLLLEYLVPMARQGLLQLGIGQEDVRYFMDIVSRRISSGQTGAAWQRAYRARHACSMRELTEAYLDNQQSNRPVHEWPI